MPDGGESVESFLGRFGFFVTGIYTDTARDQTRVEVGYDAELKGGMMGIDYRLNDKLLVGIAGGYNVEDADFDGDAGHLDTDSTNIILYGNYIPLKNIYVDGYMGFTDINYTSKRFTSTGLVTDTLTGHTDGSQYTAGLTTGYDWHYGPLAIGPQVKLDYSNTHINNYSETPLFNFGPAGDLSMKFGDQTIHSLTSNVGFQTSYAQSFSWGVLVPHSRLYWVHQYKDESRDIRSVFTIAPDRGILKTSTEKPDRNYMVFGGGVSTVMTHGVQLFADYEATFSHNFLHIWTATFGFRKAF